MARKKTGPPPPLTEQALREHAAWYLGRWWPSVSSFRRVLVRKADRHATSDEERRQGREWADAIVAATVARGALDDRRYAAAWAEELNRKGHSRRAMIAKMQQKGVSGEVAREAVRAIDDEAEGDPELKRAIAYARRRRLGPQRFDPARRAERKQKDLAAMARAGFSYGVALRVITATDLDDLDTYR
jgi:regulatory protein